MERRGREPHRTHLQRSFKESRIRFSPFTKYETIKGSNLAARSCSHVQERAFLFWDNREMTRPTHPVELLCCAIATQEGAFDPRTIPAERNNPGDLDFVGQLGMKLPPAGSPDPQIGICGSPQRGIVKIFRQIWLQVDEGQTVREIVQQWAPASAGNDSAQYLANVLAWTKLPADVPVIHLLPPLVRLN